MKMKKEYRLIEYNKDDEDVILSCATRNLEIIQDDLKTMKVAQDEDRTIHKGLLKIQEREISAWKDKENED